MQAPADSPIAALPSQGQALEVWPLACSNGSRWRRLPSRRLRARRPPGIASAIRRVRPDTAEISKRGEAALQISALDAVGHQRESASIRIRRGLERAEASEHVGAGGMEQVIPIELPGGPEFVDERPPTTRPFAHPNGDGAIQPHHRARLKAR